MNTPISTKSSKDKTAEQTQACSDERKHRPAPVGPQAEILALQRSAGNQAVSQLLESTEGDQVAPNMDGRLETAAGKGLKPLPSATASHADAKGLPSSVRSFLNSSASQPLDPATRAFMESRFGYDFGPVRIHAGGRAAESARAVNALAYTVGKHVVFGEGQYAPGTGAGKEVIAHELAHTIQQSSEKDQPPELDHEAVHERGAEQAAAFVAAGRAPVAQLGDATGVGIARKKDPEIEELVDKGLKETSPPATGEAATVTPEGQPKHQKAKSMDELIKEDVLDPGVEEGGVNTLRKKRTRLKAKLKKVPGEFAKAQGRLTDIQDELAGLQGDLSDLDEAKKRQLRIEKKRIEVVKRRLTVEKAQLRNALEDVDQEIHVLEGKRTRRRSLNKSAGFDPSAKGVQVRGDGRVNTRAAVQVVDKDGNIIAIERGVVDPDKQGHQGRHAEEVAVAKLRKRLGGNKLPPGSRIMVAGNQYVCEKIGRCRHVLRQFARDYGVTESIEAGVSVGPALRGKGKVKPKTIERRRLTTATKEAELTTETESIVRGKRSRSSGRGSPSGTGPPARTAAGEIESTPQVPGRAPASRGSPGSTGSSAPARRKAQGKRDRFSGAARPAGVRPPARTASGVIGGSSPPGGGRRGGSGETTRAPGLRLSSVTPSVGSAPSATGTGSRLGVGGTALAVGAGVVEVIAVPIINHYLEEYHRERRAEGFRKLTEQALAKADPRFLAAIEANRTAIEAAQAQGRRVRLHVVVETGSVTHVDNDPFVGSGLSSGEWAYVANIKDVQVVFEGDEPKPYDPDTNWVGDAFRFMVDVRLRYSHHDYPIEGTDEEVRRRNKVIKGVEAALGGPQVEFEELVVRSRYGDFSEESLREYVKHKRESAGALPREGAGRGREAAEYWRRMEALIDAPIYKVIARAKVKSVPLDKLRAHAVSMGESESQSKDKWSKVIGLIDAPLEEHFAADRQRFLWTQPASKKEVSEQGAIVDALEEDLAHLQKRLAEASRSVDRNDNEPPHPDWGAQRQIELEIKSLRENIWVEKRLLKDLEKPPVRRPR